MKTKPDDLINPIVITGSDTSTIIGGLTKREWFAGMALEGLLSDHEQMRSFETAARKSVKITQGEDQTITADESENLTRLRLDMLIAMRTVDIADTVIARLNIEDETEEPA